MGTYRRATDLAEALDALAERPWTILAGGTDLYPASVGRPVVADILDIGRAADLREVVVADGAVRIPALATWTDLVRADLPPAFDGLRTAARAIGGIQIQNRGTVCGNVCNASPAADGLPNLIALDASVELRSAAATRLVRAETFVTGNRRTIRRPDELVTAIVVPSPSTAARSTFLKLGARAYLVISIAMVAAVVEVGPDGRIVAARLVVGACSEVPMRIRAAEARLVGADAISVLADIAAAIRPADLEELSPIDDVRASAAYRRDAALVLLRRGVTELVA